MKRKSIKFQLKNGSMCQMLTRLVWDRTVEIFKDERHLRIDWVHIGNMDGCRREFPGLIDVKALVPTRREPETLTNQTHIRNPSNLNYNLFSQFFWAGNLEFQQTFLTYFLVLWLIFIQAKTMRKKCVKFESHKWNGFYCNFYFSMNH